MCPSDEERQRVQSELAYVRGHLEGYADVLALTDTIVKGSLVRSLREDAGALRALEDALEDENESH